MTSHHAAGAALVTSYATAVFPYGALLLSLEKENSYVQD